MSHSGSRFPDEKIPDLIESVECRPFLYDVKNKLHRNSNYSANAWNEISHEIGVPAIICKARWTTLRNYYNEIRNKALESGTSDKRAKWQHYDRLSFLNEHLGTHRRSELVNFPKIEKCSSDNSFDSILSKLTDNNKECTESYSMNHHLEDHHDDICHDLASSTRATTVNLIVQRPTTVAAAKASNDSTDDDSIYFFLKSILPRIKSLPRHMQNLFMLETMTNLMKFEQQIEDNL